MRFVIDNQLPEALSRFLVSLGCDYVHVMDVGLGKAPDVDVWRMRVRPVESSSLKTRTFFTWQTGNRKQAD